MKEDLANSNYDKTEAGIPNKEPLYKFHTEIGLTSDICSDSLNTYFLIGSKLICINKYGERIWTTDLEKNNCNGGSGIAINKNYIFACWGVFNKKNGELFLSFSEKVGLHEKKQRKGISNNYFLNEDEVLRYSKLNDKNYILNLVDESIREFFIDGKSYILKNNYESNLALIKTSDKKIGLYDITQRSPIWVKELDQGFTVKSIALNSKNVCLTLGSGLGLMNLDINTGDVNWFKDRSFVELNFNSSEYVISEILSDDLWYVSSASIDSNKLESISAISTLDGSLVWKNDTVSDLKKTVSQGDLIYSIDEEFPCAFDRFTGEKIWEASASLDSAYHVTTFNQGVYFSNTLGEVLFYEWDNPYYSSSARKKVF